MSELFGSEQQCRWKRGFFELGTVERQNSTVLAEASII